MISTWRSDSPFHQHLHRDPDPLARLPIGIPGKDLMRFAAQALKKGEQVLLRQLRQQMERVEEVAFAGPVRPDDDLEGGQFQLEVFEGLEPVDLDPV